MYKRACVPSEQEDEKKLPCPLELDGCESGDMELGTEFGPLEAPSIATCLIFFPEFTWSVIFYRDLSHLHSKTAL